MVDIEKLVVGLRESHVAWEESGVRERSKWLGRWRDWILDHEGEIADLLAGETGKPRAEAVLEIGMGLDLLNYYSGSAERFLTVERRRPHNVLTMSRRLEVHHRPYPVVGLIVPWNFPVGLTLFDAVPALLAGAAVLVKPSEFTPSAVLRLAEGWSEIGAPEVFAVVEGLADVGEAVVDNVDFIQFTGSTATGRRVAQRAATRLIPAGLELGGKDPALVLADADVSQAARGIAFGALSNTGQMCTSVERVYVVDAVHDAFVAALVAVVDELKQRPPTGATNGAVDLGTMTTTAQAAHVRRQISDAVDAGAVLLTGHRDEGEGPCVPATVLAGVDHSMEVMVEETFGPVIPVMRVADEAEAVRLANDSVYGLSASVWTKDADAAARVTRQLEVGSVDINDVSTHLACFPLPQSGWKASGIGGRLGGAAGIQKFCRTQAVNSQAFPLPLIEVLAWYPRAGWKDTAVGATLRFSNARDLKRRLGCRSMEVPR